MSLPEHPGTVNDRPSDFKVNVDVAVEVITRVVRLDFATFLPTTQAHTLMHGSHDGFMASHSQQ